MDDITQAIREQYEQFPYPAGEPTQRVSSDVRMLLSVGEKSRPDAERPLHALDAGCGRGVGLIGHAVLQPDVQFTGIDINRVGLEECRNQVQQRGLTNVRVAEVDLMTLEGLEVPEGGFDVIYSSGVLHHMSNPEQGLAKLKSVLAPHGVIALMVYATHGRQPLYRLINATKLLVPGESFDDKMPATRELAKFCSETVLESTPWDHVPDTNDVEFVDLCLNANETSYSIESMWQLLASAGMRFLRWSIPDQWSTDVLPEGTLRDLANNLSEYDQYRLIEQVTWQPSLQLLIGHEDNSPRRAFDVNAIDLDAYAVNPQIQFISEHRNHPSGKKREALLYRRYADEEPRICLEVNQLIALSILSEQFDPFTADAFLAVMQEDGVDNAGAVEALRFCIEEGILYRPHLTDLVMV